MCGKFASARARSFAFISRDCEARPSFRLGGGGLVRASAWKNKPWVGLSLSQRYETRQREDTLSGLPYRLEPFSHLRRIAYQRLLLNRQQITSLRVLPGGPVQVAVGQRESINIMHVSRFGTADGPPIILLHGGGVAGWMWNSLRKNLEPTYNVLVPDLPGHGRSADEAYRSHTETVEALGEVLSRNASKPAAVVGFSLGAQLTIELASKYPDLVDRVLVVSAQAKAMPFTGLTLRLLGATAPLAQNRSFARLQARELFVPPELMEEYIDTSVNITKSTLLAAVEENMRFEIPEAWSEFRGHALVMVGQRERALMRDSAVNIHAALPGSEFEIVEGCGHGIPLQRPDWFNDRVAAWLTLP